MRLLNPTLDTKLHTVLSGGSDTAPGRIVLYKRADHQNPKWTVRLKIPRTKGFVVKSETEGLQFLSRCMKNR